MDMGHFINEIIDLNSKNVTWKSKLEFTNNLVIKYQNDQNFSNFRTEGLAILAAFHYFINSG